MLTTPRWALWIFVVVIAVLVVECNFSRTYVFTVVLHDV